MNTDADPKKNTVLIEKGVSGFLLYEHIVKWKYVNVHYWEVYLSRPVCMSHVWWEQFYWYCMYAKITSSKSY